MDIEKEYQRAGLDFDLFTVEEISLILDELMALPTNVSTNRQIVYYSDLKKLIINNS